VATHSDFERTIQFGEKALKHLRVHEGPAYPKNYELWYTYVAGFNRQLNQALNNIIRKDGKISSDVMDQIYEDFLSPGRMGDRVEEVNSKFVKEFEVLMNALDNASVSTSDFGASLNNANKELLSATGSDQIKLVVQKLVTATKEMESKTTALEDRLATSRQQIDVLHDTLETVRTESMTDALTGIANRKRFDETIALEVAAANETKEPLTLVIGDIDHFKKFNDTFGHQTGDQVLRLVAFSIRETVKGRDLAARYGGEEFAVVLPQTDMEAAMTVSDQMRKAVMAKELVKKSTGESLGTITMSFGVSLFRPGEPAEDLIARADAALYTAKDAGRNCVMNEGDIEDRVLKNSPVDSGDVENVA
jgi:diguanylate cyclase